MLNPVKLPVAIYLCLICLLLTCFVADRPNVQDQSLVERLQHTYVEALHSYICINRPNVSAWPEHHQWRCQRILCLCRQSSCSTVCNWSLAACTVMLIPSGLFDSSYKCKICELSQSALLYHVPYFSQHGKSGVLWHDVLVFFHTASSWRMLGLEEVKIVVTVHHQL